MSGQFALFAGDFLLLQEDLLPIEIVSAALASVAVVVIFLPLAGDQGRPPAPAGDDGLLAPGAPGRHVSHIAVSAHDGLLLLASQEELGPLQHLPALAADKAGWVEGSVHGRQHLVHDRKTTLPAPGLVQSPTVLTLPAPVLPGVELVNDRSLALPADEAGGMVGFSRHYDGGPLDGEAALATNLQSNLLVFLTIFTFLSVVKLPNQFFSTMIADEAVIVIDVITHLHELIIVIVKKIISASFTFIRSQVQFRTR